jgi:hypothetical protein
MEWTAVILIDWLNFFSNWYIDRDMSQTIFFMLLVVQVHIVQVLMHSSIRHVEEGKAKREDQAAPTHRLATEELTQMVSTRSSHSRMSSTGSSTASIFERYRLIIADEVSRSQAVQWRRFKFLQFFQAKLVALLEYLPLEKVPTLQRSYKNLKQPWRENESMQGKRYRRAIRYIHLAQEHRNILTVCALRKGSKFAALQCYLVLSSWTYQTFIQAIILMHMVTQAVQPSKLDFDEAEEEGRCAVKWDGPMQLSLLCILIEAADVIIWRWIASVEMQVSNPAKRRRARSFSLGSSMFDGNNMLQSRTEVMRQTLRVVTFIAIAIEWFFLATFCWPAVLFGYFPLTLRPVYLLLSNANLFSTFINICSTVATRGMRSVTVCFLILWLLAAMIASTMLRSQGNGFGEVPAECLPPSPPQVGPPPPPPPMPSNTMNARSYTSVSFQSIVPSMLSTFILISTGENYADVVSRQLFCFNMQAESIDEMPPRVALVTIFWVLLSLVGLVMMVGMFIGVFQDGFVRQRHSQQTQVKLFERVGAIAAFTLLDVEDSPSGVVSLTEFVAFLEYLEKNEDMSFVVKKEDLFTMLRDSSDDAGQDNTLDLSSFVFNLWFLQLKGVVSVRAETNTSSSLPRLRALYNHPSLIMQKLVKFVLLVHALLACLYGFLHEEGRVTLDQWLAFLLLLEAAEVGLKLWVHGLRRFWNAGMFDVGNTFEQWENRTALLIGGGTLLAWLITRAPPYADGLGFKADADLHRVVLIFPAVRLFFTLKQARRVFFVLIPLRKYLGSVLMLMLIFNFMYAQLGEQLFAGELKVVAAAIDTDAVRLNSFDTLASSMLTLVQILVGEGWDDIMYAVMNMKHSWYWALYFLVYVIVQTLLLTSLLVGVVLDSTSGFSIEEESSLQQTVLYGEQLRELAELDEMRHSFASRGLMSEASPKTPANGLFVGPSDLLVGHRNDNGRRASLATTVSPQDPSPGMFAREKTRRDTRPMLLPILSRLGYPEEHAAGGRRGKSTAGQIQTDSI